MNRIEDAVFNGPNKAVNAANRMMLIAQDDSHGYDQSCRWGERGDYDCSSLIIQVYEDVGVPVKSAGASYTGNMKEVFLRCGFEDVTALAELESGMGLEKGDVLLHHRNHTAMVVDLGLIAEANINELGSVSGGLPGDQTGREIWLRGYYNYPWQAVLRYTGVAPGQGSAPAAGRAPTYFYNNIRLPLLKKGMESSYVAAVQELLRAKGYYNGETDAVYADETERAVLAFQSDRGLEADGETGRITWTSLLGG